MYQTQELPLKQHECGIANLMWVSEQGPNDTPKPHYRSLEGAEVPENRISFVDEETRVLVAAPQGGVGKWIRMYYLEGNLWGKSRSDCSLPWRSNVIESLGP